MPYIHCQSCRLTLYEAHMFALLATSCPRCGGEIDRKPAPLFADAAGRKRKLRVAASNRFARPPATPLPGEQSGDVAFS